MRMNKFCCCCDLRRGCIVFSWLQLMLICLNIAAMAIPLNVLKNISTFDEKQNMNYDVLIYTLLNICIAQQSIKGITNIALIFGLIKKQHLFYQPWLFVTGIECVFLTLNLILFFFLGVLQMTLFFTAMIPLLPVTFFAWYFFFCIHTVYKQDEKGTTIAFDDNEYLLQEQNV